MARIEITLDEYNDLNSRIKELEGIVISQEKETEKDKTVIESLKEIVSFFINLSFVERAFKWSKIMRNADKGIYE